MRSRAAFFLGPDAGFALEARPLPTPGAGELLVAIECATVCASDLHTFTGRRPAPTPLVLGHEMTGRVAAAGPGAELFLGQRIVWSMLLDCGECLYCRRGLPSSCPQLRKFGHDRDPWLGGFAEHCLLPAGTRVYPIPASLPDEVAAIAMCAGATAVSVLREAELSPGESLLVYGAGPLGLLTTAFAAASGIRVFVHDPDPERLAAAAQFGARPLAALGATGVDAVAELSGAAAALEDVFEYLRPGGRLLLAGAVYPGPVLTAAADQLIKHRWRISGVYNYAPADLATALQLLAPPAVAAPVRRWVRGVFSLDAIAEAFAFACHQRPLRVALYPGRNLPA